MPSDARVRRLRVGVAGPGAGKHLPFLTRIRSAAADRNTLTTVIVMKKFLSKLWRSEDGPTAVEYAVMLALLMGVFIGSIKLIGVETQRSVEKSSDSIDTAFTEAGVGNF